MSKFHYIGLIMSLILLVQAVNASHQVEYRAQTRITTTVGELTTLQVDIKNAGSTIEFYQVNFVALPSNGIEITNPSVTTQALNPGQTVSVFTNIRTLTEAPVVLTVQIYPGGDLSHFLIPPPTISIASKKYSLPEFGLVGFMQIIAIAAIVYFLFGNRIKASRQ